MRRWFFATLCFVWIVSASADQPSSEDLFQKGLAAYQNKQFDEARDNFLNLVAGGQASPALFHNLALAFFQLDQKPFAMAFWRKALALDPSFRPALAGRQMMESKFNMTSWEKDTFNLWIRRTMEGVSFYELAWLIAFVIGGAGWIWIRYLAARKIAIEDEQPKPAFPMIAAGLAVIFVGTLALMALKFSALQTTHATVVQPKINARSLPADEGVGLFELGGGVEVVIRRTEGDWLQVQNSDGATGWVKKSEVLVTDERVRL